MDEQTAVLPESQKAVERCTGCGKPMADDQRYCLNCGKRRGKARIEFENYIPEAGGNGNGNGAPPVQGDVRPVPEDEPDPRPQREVTPLMAAVGLCGVAAILLIGVLIGRSGGGESSSSQPQFIASTGVPATSSTTSTTSTSTTVTIDWPQSQEGFTIELATLSKEGSDPATVEAAKADLTSQGATDVGVIDSDQFGSLPPGNYVLYSGTYSSKSEAQTALSSLSGDFPDAQVIEVSADSGDSSTGAGKGQTTSGATSSDGSLTDGSAADSTEAVQASEEDLQDLDNATGEEYEEIQKKLPPTISTPGEAPPKDDKAPGGGGDATTIG